MRARATLRTLFLLAGAAAAAAAGAQGFEVSTDPPPGFDDRDITQFFPGNSFQICKRISQ